MVELRKRKAPVQPPAIEKRAKKGQSSTTTPTDTAKKHTSKSSGLSSGIPGVGDTIVLEGFGGEIETSEGTKTTLKNLVDASHSGVVLFTYPRASTPGCTKQACLFRDSYDHITSTGLSVYGLSTDSPKANTTFKTKQNLPYSLLCDTSAALIAAIGFKKEPKGTTRGVFAVDKTGKVLLLQAGGPDATVQAVVQLISTNLKKDELKPETKASRVTSHG
ncbi:hypothetical protein ASPWEDRAFT_34797 [Aspergillus wentii DTO 134E9]|uniref:thioredoxin-dependent peroxiredoxin n=1 Tax=Aspergillus wentii DTO 134E9 TaxID=1073089 RepID=A0A1L9S290_ASPWE|nr:uncharacterized protein ASPWEDRAFT_34797 [Aspergillus wentii DTO 134E9]OJJ41272.1 hypothetical protein ASPWEDRAFT_34797 [Aspergillus wentii DTO 134E9]